MDPYDRDAAGQRWQLFMEEAALRMEAVARDGEGEAADCARRVLHSPRSWGAWERDFGASMRPIATYKSRMLQVRALRQASFTWVHKAAPFRYLRTHKLRGQRRRRLVATLYGQYAGYEHSLVVEHGTYLNSVCSGLCAEHIGQDVLADLLYRDSMERYQTLYMEYFRAFGVFTCGHAGHSRELAREMLPLMKQQLNQLRKALLQHPLRAGWLERELVMRRPTGDTQKMQRLDFNLD